MSPGLHKLVRSLVPWAEIADTCWCVNRLNAALQGPCDSPGPCRRKWLPSSRPGRLLPLSRSSGPWVVGHRPGVVMNPAATSARLAPSTATSPNPAAWAISHARRTTVRSSALSALSSDRMRSARSTSLQRRVCPSCSAIPEQVAQVRRQERIDAALLLPVHALLKPCDGRVHGSLLRRCRLRRTKTPPNACHLRVGPGIGPTTRSFDAACLQLVAMP